MYYTTTRNEGKIGEKIMTMNYGQFYPNYQPQYQRLQQLEQQYQNTQQQYQQAIQQQFQNKIYNVANEDIAKNTQIPLDGSSTYFVFGDTILARNWNIAEGCVNNRKFKLETDNDSSTPEKIDRLKIIEEKIDELNNKLTYPINKKKEIKEVKDAE